MTKAKFTERLNFLLRLGLLEKPEFSEETIDLWYHFFKDYDGDIFLEAIYLHLFYSNFFPRISELIKRFKECEKSVKDKADM